MIKKKTQANPLALTPCVQCGAKITSQASRMHTDKGWICFNCYKKGDL